MSVDFLGAMGPSLQQRSWTQPAAKREKKKFPVLYFTYVAPVYRVHFRLRDGLILMAQFKNTKISMLQKKEEKENNTHLTFPACQ